MSIGHEEERPLVRLSHLLNAIAALMAIAAIAMIIGLALYAYGHQGRVYQGVSVAGVDIGGMTETQAVGKLERGFASYMNSPLLLSHDGQTYAITPNELGLRLDAEASVEAAMEIGRQGSVWKRSQDWAQGLFGGATVDASVVAEPSITDGGLMALTGAVARPPVDASIDFNSDTPSIVPEVLGVGYDVGVTKALVLQRVSDRSNSPIEVATTTLQPEVTAAILEQTLPSTQSALANAMVIR